MMTEKDFQELAGCLGPALAAIPLVYTVRIINPLCDFLRTQNPQFSRGEFIAALVKKAPSEKIADGN